MNYYERHLGDYAKDTGHLSILEHGAYTLLLDRYYSTEAGIPETQAFRLARARTPEEREAVEVVLAEFFELIDGVWINRRAEEEIQKAKARIEAAKENGRKGGRPSRCFRASMVGSRASSSSGASPVSQSTRTTSGNFHRFPRGAPWTNAWRKTKGKRPLTS